MASDDYDDDEPFDYGSLPEIQQQEFLYDQIGFVGQARDYEAHNMFWDVFYNDELSTDSRMDLYQQFVDYIWDEYGMNFAELWDWDDFREWYALQ